MKRLKLLVKKLRAPLPTLCYGACLALWLLGSLLGFGSDFVQKAAGSLYQFQLAYEDFEPVNLHRQENGVLLTENDDPQMIWQNDQGLTVRTLRMEASFSRSPREMCLYYTTKPGEPFSVNKRVFAAQNNDGSYVYTLPQGRIAALRLDPCSPLENKPVEIELSGIYLNEAAAWWSYFSPGWAGAFRMALYPGLAAAALSLAREALLWYKNKKRV